MFNKLLHLGDKEPKSAPEKTTSLTNTKLDELLDDDEEEETKSDLTPDVISETETVVSSETTIDEPEVEEETNWDFLDEEPETTSEKTTKKEE